MPQNMPDIRVVTAMNLAAAPRNPKIRKIPQEPKLGEPWRTLSLFLGGHHDLHRIHWDILYHIIIYIYTYIYMYICISAVYIYIYMWLCVCVCLRLYVIYYEKIWSNNWHHPCVGGSQVKTKTAFFQRSNCLRCFWSIPSPAGNVKRSWTSVVRRWCSGNIEIFER